MLPRERVKRKELEFRTVRQRIALVETGLILLLLFIFSSTFRQQADNLLAVFILLIVNTI